MAEKPFRPVDHPSWNRRHWPILRREQYGVCLILQTDCASYVRWEFKNKAPQVFSDLRCTPESPAAGREHTPSCHVKSIDDQTFIKVLRRRMLSSIWVNGGPIKVTYATRGLFGRTVASMDKTDSSETFGTWFVGSFVGIWGATKDTFIANFQKYGGCREKGGRADDTA